MADYLIQYLGLILGNCAHLIPSWMNIWLSLSLEPWLKFISGSCVQNKYPSFPFYTHSYPHCSQYRGNEKGGNWKSIEDFGTLMGIHYTFRHVLCWWSVSLGIVRWTVMAYEQLISLNRCFLVHFSVVKRLFLDLLPNSTLSNDCVVWHIERYTFLIEVWTEYVNFH